MAKYALTSCVNGNYSVVSEHTELRQAIVAFHNTAAAYWNAGP